MPPKNHEDSERMPSPFPRNRSTNPLVQDRLDNGDQPGLTGAMRGAFSPKPSARGLRCGRDQALLACCAFGRCGGPAEDAPSMRRVVSRPSPADRSCSMPSLLRGPRRDWASTRRSGTMERGRGDLRVGFAEPSTTFYPCRVSPGHLMPHTPPGSPQVQRPIYGFRSAVADPARLRASRNPFVPGRAPPVITGRVRPSAWSCSPTPGPCHGVLSATSGGSSPRSM